jgi:hypothetical protein
LLAGAVPDATWLRGVLIAGLGMALVTLFVRIGAEVVRSTEDC